MCHFGMKSTGAVDLLLMTVGGAVAGSALYHEEALVGLENQAVQRMRPTIRALSA
jgi:hypothetical protein